MLKRQFLPTYSQACLTGLILAIGSTFCATISQAISPEGLPKPPTPIRDREVHVKIVSAKALSQFDPFIVFTSKHKADFFSVVRFNDQINHKTRKINDNDNPTFNQILKVAISKNLDVIPVEIYLVDSDADNFFEQFDHIRELTDGNDVHTSIALQTVAF